MDDLILGIETSCDETAAAVYSPSKGMLSSELYSQWQHSSFGGVVPEMASRSHLEKINEIIQHALQKANVTLNDIETIAVTNKPGLPGSLLVGLNFAKGIAWSTNKKLIGVDHLEGHAFSAQIENQIPFPYLCITASGGHTSMYLIEDFGVYTVLGQTLDDAAGEAFDKIAKWLNYPYPGGPIIEKLAEAVQFKDFYKYPRSKHKTLDFSFSGLKTAALYDLANRSQYDLKTKKFIVEPDEQLKKEVSSSLLVCITDIFKQKLELAHQQCPQVKAVAFVGGVACNKYIKAQLRAWAEQRGLQFFTPSPKFCTDNGGMIAFVGSYKASQGKFSDFSLDILK